MPVRSEVEKKLAEYRAKQERDARINYYKAQAKSMISRFIGKNDEKHEDHTKDNELREALLEEDNSSTGTQDKNTNLELKSSNEQIYETVEDDSLSIYDYTYYILWFILWVTIYAIFIKLEFGTIYLIISGMLGMYVNTRTGPKQKNEISAYSVFNKNCESIDGTLKGEQLTREMLYGGFR